MHLIILGATNILNVHGSWEKKKKSKIVEMGGNCMVEKYLMNLDFQNH
jgi:hypothetical protein